MAYEGFSADAALTTPIAGDHCQCSINPCGCKTKTTVAGYSVQGKRFENEDAVRCYETEGLSVAVVADGIGGAPYGGIISNVAVGSFMDEVIRGSSPRKAFEEANNAATNIVRWLDSAGSGSTLACASVQGLVATVVWAGDSLAYLWRKGALRRITDPMRSADGALSGYVGREVEALPSLRKVRLCLGDKIVLCTDGVWDSMSDDSMERILAESDEAKSLACRLANEGAVRGRDNSTAAVFCVESAIATSD